MLLGGSSPTPPLTWGTFFHYAGMSLIMIIGAIIFIIVGKSEKLEGEQGGATRYVVGWILLATALIGDFALFITVLTKQAGP